MHTQCGKVKKIGDLVTGEPGIEALVNRGSFGITGFYERREVEVHFPTAISK